MDRGKRIGKGLIRVIYMAGVFFISLLIFSSLMNRGNTDMTTELGGSKYPVISFLQGEQRFNSMHAYATEMDKQNMREQLTPMGQDRHLNILIDCYGEEVRELRVQLYSLVDGRLIEDTPLTDYVQEGETVRASVTLKDLIKNDVEYSLCFVLGTDNYKELRYYTNIVRCGDVYMAEKLDFIRHFDDLTFDKSAASEELPTYLESGDKGDNTTFRKVDIHSSLHQVTWGDMPVQRLTEPVATIYEMDASTAQMSLDYIVQVAYGGRIIHFFVKEDFRLRRGKDRIYLLDYQREMEEIFDRDSWVINNNKVVLGIADDNPVSMESADGNYLAFVQTDCLYAYDLKDNRMAEIFGFYDNKTLTDRRTTLRDHGFSIYKVTETGNVYFSVYGYMNGGFHEGHCGVCFYMYDSARNMTEELAFMIYDGQPACLISQMGSTGYMSSAGMAYYAVDGTFYKVDLANGRQEVLAEGMDPGAFAISQSKGYATWYVGQEPENVTSMTAMNLENGETQEVKGVGQERLKLLGYFGEDLIIGVAKTGDIIRDEADRAQFLMYCIRIRGANGIIKKEYKPKGMLIREARLEGNILYLKRVTREEDGSLAEAPEDQILNSTEETARRNTFETVITEMYEKVVQIALRRDVDPNTLQVLDPRFVIHGEERTGVMYGTQKAPEYTVWSMGTLAGRYDEAADAVQKAGDCYGLVRDGGGQVVFRYTEIPEKNQIMRITGRAAGSEAGAGELLAECIREMLEYYGVAADISGSEVRNRSTREVMQEKYPEALVMNLSGISLDTVLRFPAGEVPVLVCLRDGSGMLLIGYNSLSVVVMDPSRSKDPVYKINREKAEELFGESGNCFYAYHLDVD